MRDEDRLLELLGRLRERLDAGDDAPADPGVALDEATLQQAMKAIRALDAAYAGDVPLDAGVLGQLSLALPVSSIVLREPLNEPAPPVCLPGGLDRCGRFEVLGEVARGGVGVVLRARDPDLGRDVALKVLRPEHAAHPDLIQRFVEEAQVGGQLQHPGIVPVYEMGVDSVSNPFFAMKLIRGRTLSALFAERATPAEGLPRFLSIFESVCQTLSYAHARGVVHRDLKPSNVMVGPFGEVQVVDWGMAKILAGAGRESASGAAPAETVVTSVRTRTGSSQSVHGSVLGTPRYMAPEQARGEVEAIDERTDVFALGGILLELLTASPPYEESDALAAAGEARLGPALERLNGAETDVELKALVRACLSVRREERPRDAGAVARAVSEHLASLQQRARAAEVDIARARLEVAHQRRTKRLGLALGVTVSLAGLLGAGGWVAWQSAAHRRRTSADQAVQTALDDVATRRAAAAASADTMSWRGVTEAARQAVRLAHASGPDPSTVTRADVLLYQVEHDAAEVARAEARRAKDQLMSMKLDEAAYGQFELVSLADTLRAFREAFRSYGWDLDTPPTSELLEEAKTSSIAWHLALVLDHWARDTKTAQFLRPAIDLIDSDPWRRRLRALSTEAEILEFASQADLTTLSRVDGRVLMAALRRLPASDRAYAISKRWYLLHPDDFWAAIAFGHKSFARASASGLRLGRVYASDTEVGRFALESAQAWVRATTLRPRAHVAWTNLGDALWVIGDREGGLDALDRALALRPEDDDIRLRMADYLLQTSNGGPGLDRAIALWNDVLVRGADPRVHVSLAGGYVKAGRALEAEEQFQKALQADPRSHWAYGERASFRANAGRLEEALADARRALDLEPSFAHAAYVEAWVRHRQADEVIAGGGDARNVLREAESGYRRALSLGYDPRPVFTDLGLVLRKLGDFDGALQSIRSALQLSPRDDVRKEGVQELVALGRPGEAVALASVGVSLEASAASLNLLAFALDAAGRSEEAHRTRARALVMAPADLEAAMSLADSQLLRGEFRDAGVTLDSAIRAGLADPSVSARRRYIGVLEDVEGRLPESLREGESSGVRSRIALGQVLAHRDPLQSVRWFESAHGRDPRAFLDAGVLATVIGAFVRAAETDPAHLATVLGWMEALVSRVEESGGYDEVLLLRSMPGLSPLRDPASLDRLPDAERDRAILLWARLDAVLRSLRR